MSKTLYFAKININDANIFRIYNNTISINEIMEKLFDGIDNGITFNRKIRYKKNGQEHIEEQDFIFTSINKYSEEEPKVLVGNIVKTSKIYINKVNKTTGEKFTTPVDNDEIVKFCFCPAEEIVAFYCANRFGYKTFCSAFEGLLCKVSEISGDETEYFKVSLLNNGTSLENIKNELKKMKNIETLRISIIPPNPNKELLTAIKENGEKRLENLQEGRIAEKSILFKSRDKRGLNSEAKEIVNELDAISEIHSHLTVEESTSKGYVEVEAKSKDGRIYNTNKSKIIKDKMPDDIVSDKAFSKYCRKRIVVLCIR